MFHPVDLFVCVFCFVLFNKRKKKEDEAKILAVNNSALFSSLEKWMRCLHLKTWFKLYPLLSQVDVNVSSQLSVM